MEIPDSRLRLWRSPRTIAGLAAMLVLLLQAIYVYSNYEGNWTALFLTGSLHPVPADLKASTWVFEGAGYDGQWYRYIAHDLGGVKQSVPAQEEPIYRRRRILIPALAFLLGGGQPGLIDAGYIGVILLSVFLGVLWTATLARRYGRPAAEGLVFLLIPAAIISAQRMAVDVATLACTAGFFVFLPAPGAGLLAVLAGASLTRETGWLLGGAATAWFLFQRNWRWAALSAASLTPAGLWYVWLSLSEPVLGESGALGIPYWVGWTMKAGLVRRILAPLEYPGQPEVWREVYHSLDLASWAGMLLTLLLVPLSFRRTRWMPFHWLALGHIALFFLVDTIGFWVDPNSWSRVFSSLSLAWIVAGWERKSPWRVWTGLGPSLAIDLRLWFALSWMASSIWRLVFA